MARCSSSPYSREGSARRVRLACWAGPRIETALKEKERLYFVEHRHGNQFAKANGVTFEGAVPAEHEVYFSLTDLDTVPRAHHDSDPSRRHGHRRGRQIPGGASSVDQLTGFKAFVVANALSNLKAPKEIISPLVQHLPKLWELLHDYGMTTLELNPIRMRPDRSGRLTPVACDFKCGFDRDDPRWQRLQLPQHLFAVDYSDFEHEINQLRTYQGQSDVYVINAEGTILAPTFGGGANSLVTELLGDNAIISSDFGGNPPYGKMKAVAEICFKHWLKQTNVLFIIGGKSNNTDIFETFRAWRMLSASTSAGTVRLRSSSSSAAAGPIWCAAWAPCATPWSARPAIPHLWLDSDMSEVINYASRSTHG